MMPRILGIDPGFIHTGYAIVEGDGRVNRLCGVGVLHLSGETDARMKEIFVTVSNIIAEHQPQEMAIETVFMYKSATAALKLGHARGAAICAGVVAGLPTYEYNTRFIKKTITGKGNATKEQVRFMTAKLLHTTAAESDDAADAMAIALCRTFSGLRSFRMAEALK